MVAAVDGIRFHYRIGLGTKDVNLLNLVLDIFDHLCYTATVRLYVMALDRTDLGLS